MKIINGLIRIIDKIINIAVTLFLLFILFIGLYAIYDYYYITKHTEISKEIINLQSDEKENDSISLEKLKEINKDIIGWIKIDDTVVDYPLLIGDDNNEYLYADYNKKYAVTGSIFMDYRNKDNFTDEYSIIYGHNMASGKMFGSFLKYANKDYLLKHNKGTIIADKTYDIEIIGYTIKSAYDKIYDLKMNKNELYNYYKEDAYVFIDKPINDGENLLILSTCDSANRNDRRILLVKYKEQEIEIKPVEEEKIVNNEVEKEKSNINLIGTISIFAILLLLLIFIIIKVLLNKSIKKKNETIDNEIETL